MRKVILWMSISLDGYFEGPDRDISWHKVDAELHDHMNRELAKMSAFLTGRKTHELMAGFWPAAEQTHPGDRQMAEFAALWKRMPKYVYSRTWQDTSWNSVPVRAVVPAEVRALKALPGGDMTVGGAELDAEFMRLGLIDEFRIYVHPVVVGQGKPLFPEGTRMQELRLLETKAFGNGVVMMRYEKSASLAQGAGQSGKAGV